MVGRYGKAHGAAAVVAAIILGACSQGSDAPSEGAAERPETTPAPSPSPSETSTGAARAAFNPQEVSVELVEVAAGMSSPLGVAHAGDGSGRLYVVEQTGAIRVIQRGRLMAEPFLDISDRIVSGGEQGLLGLAFHPGYRRNGRFYVNYTDVNGDTIVAEYRTTPDPLRADPSSERVLLQIEQPFPNHNGGHVAFGPDGYLYVGTGDGGSGGDPQGNGQSLSTLLGKLLRIDVDERGGSRPYGIPSDNPFIGRAGARPEIWAYGLRNPWRFSFDREAGQLWIGDVGQDQVEEIDRAPDDVAGINYGWNEMEGRSCFTSGCNRNGKHLPLSEYSHDPGCSVTGGHVYRGRAFPELRGGYFFGDFCSGALWAIDSASRRFAPPVPVLEADISISSFGVDERGELYVTDLASGSLMRVTSGR